MDITREALLERARTETGQKLFRFAMVSVVSTVCGTSLFFLAHEYIGLTAKQSNLFSVSISTLPAYLLSRRWVWRGGGRADALEVVMFWIIAFVGLGWSTIVVSVAERHTESTLLLIGSQLSAYGSLWIGRFLLLDKWLFKVAEIIEHQVEEHGLDGHADNHATKDPSLDPPVG